MGIKIMVIDDSSIVRGMLKKVIGLSGIDVQEVIEAADGKQALDKLAGGLVDLAFLDINMPVMNGMEFMEKVRADDAMKALPVVVVSTEGSQERIKRMQELEVKHYLRKPVTPEQISTVVKELLGASHG
jgi:two-component system chemotaxis response regulator CheY